MKVSGGAVVCLLGALLLGGYLRTVRLGEGYLFIDDFNHHFAARSLNAGEGPRLPSGREYTRGLDLTRFVSLSQRWVDDSELADRLPAAVFGIANLGLFGAIAWRLGGPWAAAAAALLLAVYPEAVHQSRQVRFYTYQLNFGLLAMYAGWRVVESAGSPGPHPAGHVRRGWLWAVAALLAFALAARVQITTGSVVAGFGVAVFIAATADAVALGARRWRESVPLQLAAAGLLAVASVALFAPAALGKLWEHARWMPPNFGAERPASFYYHQLHEQFPLLAGLTPIAVLVSLAVRPRVTVYLLAWFAVPFLLHSYVFTWKAERYVFVAVPALFLIWGIALAAAGRFAYRGVLARLGAAGAPGWVGPAVAAGLIAAGAYPILRTPAFWDARRLAAGATDYNRDDWAAAAQQIHRVRGTSTMPVGSSIALASLMYGMPVDFSVHRPASETPEGRVEGQDAARPAGAADFYSGLPVLTTPAAIRARFAGTDTALIVVDSTRWRAPRIIDERLQHALATEAVDACAGRCGRLILFVWPLGGQSALTASGGSPGLP